MLSVWQRQYYIYTVQNIILDFTVLFHTFPVVWNRANILIKFKWILTFNVLFIYQLEKNAFKISPTIYFICLIIQVVMCVTFLNLERFLNFIIIIIVHVLSTLIFFFCWLQFIPEMKASVENQFCSIIQYNTML